VDGGESAGHGWWVDVRREDFVAEATGPGPMSSLHLGWAAQSFVEFVVEPRRAHFRWNGLDPFHSPLAVKLY
jgi:hypothetical protein